MLLLVYDDERKYDIAPCALRIVWTAERFPMNLADDKGPGLEGITSGECREAFLTALLEKHDACHEHPHCHTAAQCTR